MNKVRTKPSRRIMSAMLAGLAAILIGAAPASAVNGTEPTNTEIGMGSTVVVELFTGLTIVLDNPLGLTYKDNGALYFVDQKHHRIFTSNGTLAVVVAGTGDALSNGDGGKAVDASVLPSGLAFGPDGKLYFSERATNVIRVIDTDGNISRFAGTGAAASTGDGGPATAAAIKSPEGLAFDADGNLYVGEHNGARIRRIGTNGIITTVAGTGVSGDSGDGGPAIAAMIGQPGELAFDGEGNLIFADTLRSRVRHIGPTGIITTIAGTGSTSDFVASGPASSTPLAFPRGLAVDPSGEIYISSKNRVFKIRHDGNLVPVAGTGTTGSAGEGGPAFAAQFDTITSLAINSDGDVATAEATQGGVGASINRIRVIRAGENCRRGPVDASWHTDNPTRASIYRLYCAYFLRFPDTAGYNYWFDEIEGQRITITGISDLFGASKEFDQTYGSLSNAQFLDLLYGNIMERKADPVGRDHWLGVLDNGTLSRGGVVLQFSDSAEFRQRTGTS